VVLGSNGKIAEKGTYDSLRSQAGYISSILLKSVQQPTHSSESSAHFASSKTPEDEIKDFNRKTGDVSVYRK
jgi:ATP-binding cassette, subfamily C (CFTR/MRP), member 1